MNKAKLLSWSVLVICLGSLAASQTAVEARAERVERGLSPGIVIAGRPLPANSLADRMAALKVPGVSIAVINDGVIEWAKGYGLAEAGSTTPVTARTLFQAASISKPVAALAALRLVEQGRLTLDEDVNAKLASWKVPDNEFTRSEKVTLRRLLSHTAGLTVHGFGGYRPTPQCRPWPRRSTDRSRPTALRSVSMPCRGACGGIPAAAIR